MLQAKKRRVTNKKTQLDYKKKCRVKNMMFAKGERTLKRIAPNSKE